MRAGPGSGADLDPASVQQQSIATLDFVNGLVDGIDEMAQGDLSNVGTDLGLPDSTALRAADQVVWVLDVQATETDATGTASYDVLFWLQFRDSSGIPQQMPDSTTAAMEMRLDFLIDAHAEDSGSVFDLTMDYDMNLTVAGLPDGPYPVDGSGSLTMSMLWTSPGQNNPPVSMAAAWVMDLDVPADGGCASGTVTVTVENYTFLAALDGQGAYSWQLLESGVQIDQGTELVSCGLPPL